MSNLQNRREYLQPKEARSRRLRVCHIASGDLWAGAEVQITVLLSELRMCFDLEVSAVLLNRGKLYDELRAIDIPVAIYDETRLNSLQILKALRSYLIQQRPQVVHTHGYKENVLVGIAGKFSSVPLTVHTVHGLDERLTGWERIKINAYSRMNRMAMKWSSQCIIAVSNEIANSLMQTLPKSRVLCVHNGIDLRKVRPAINNRTKRAELGLPEHALVVGAVGRLVPVKGIEFLLYAIRALYEDLRPMPIRLLIVGDGPLRTNLEILAKQLGIEGLTLFLGMRDDVYDLMNVMDIYTLPSLHEGIPMALLEALALGRAAIASRVGGIPEVLTDSREGKLVPAQDINSLRDALKELAVSPRLREKLGNAGRQRIARYYESKKMARTVTDLYWHFSTEHVQCSA